MKKFKMFCLLLVSFFVCTNVKAWSYGQDSTPLDGSSCVDDHNCLLICQYQIEHKQIFRTDYHQVSIYYHLGTTPDDGFWQVAWATTSYGGFVSLRGDFDVVFDSEQKNAVYMSKTTKDKLRNNGICPDLAYVDLSVLGNSEVCFTDNDNPSYCDIDPTASAIGGWFVNFTDFNGSTTKTYANSNHIDTYLKDYAFANISCDDLKKSNDIGEKLQGNFLKDFQENYLHGHANPYFLQNYIFGSSDEIPGKIDEQKQVLKDKCTEEISSDPNTSEAEKAEQLAQLESGLEDLDQAITSVRDQMLKPSISLSNRTGCDIFGSLTDELRTIFQTIRFLMIGALIALTILDFIKAFASTKDDEYKKALRRFITRVIIIVVLFILPLIINIVLGIFFGGGFDTCLGTF